jgi:hypothetical protein
MPIHRGFGSNGTEVRFQAKFSEEPGQPAGRDVHRHCRLDRHAGTEQMGILINTIAKDLHGDALRMA